MKPILVIGLLLLAGAVAAQSPGRAPQIRSRADLTSYLDRTPSGRSPLDALSPGARRRFIGSLQFGPSGVSSFDPGDLAEELTNHQVRRILALFGLEAELSAVHVDSKPLRGSAGGTRVERQFDRFYFGQLSGPDGASLRAGYDTLLAREQRPRILGRAEAHDVDLLFRAATHMAEVSADQRYLRDARMDFNELVRRGYAGPERV